MITPQQEVYYEKIREGKRQAYRQLNRQSLAHPELIFIGDSITEWFPIEQLFTTTKIWANRGIAASNSQHLIDHLDTHAFGLSLREVVLLIGTNDLAYDLPLETTVANVRAMITQLQEDYPLLTVYLLEVIPVNEAADYQTVVLNRTNKAIQAINQAYAQLAVDLSHVVLIKTYDHFLDTTGQLDRQLTTDGLHLSEKGYEKLAELIQPVV